MSDTQSIGIIVFDGVLTSEVIGPAEVFGIARERPWGQNWQVCLIGVDDRPDVTTGEGIRLGVDATIHDDLDLSVLIVPGAYDLTALFANDALNAFIRRHEAAGDWIGSNCSGAFLLANAGVLDGRRATTWHGGEAALKADFPAVDVIFDSPVVVDNRRITSNGGVISYEAALALLARLAGLEQAREVYDSLGFGRLGGWAAIAAASSAEAA